MIVYPRFISAVCMCVCVWVRMCFCTHVDFGICQQFNNLVALAPLAQLDQNCFVARLSKNLRRTPTRIAIGHRPVVRNESVRTYKRVMSMSVVSKKIQCESSHEKKRNVPVCTGHNPHVCVDTGFRLSISHRAVSPWLPRNRWVRLADFHDAFWHA